MSTYEVDLRSDTVTRPTTAMWDAMRSAPLGDDVLGDAVRAVHTAFGLDSSAGEAVVYGGTGR